MKENITKMSFREYSDYGEFIIFISGMFVVGIFLRLFMKLFKWEIFINEKNKKY